MLTTKDYMKAFHEIKNSITIVNSSLQLVEKKHPEIVDSAYWQESREALDYLKEMIQELSQARLSEDLCLRPVDPACLLQNILCSIRSFQENSGFHCQTKIATKLPMILADTFRLTQAIINLIKNSYEAMNQSGTILLTADALDAALRIAITDFGGGIDPEYADQLFLPFVTSKENGTGLGLAISKQIVEHHHGTLTYESRANDGCTFIITLPAIH